MIFFSRLCLKYEAYAGGYIKLETKIYHYGTTAAQKNLCYFYDDQAPLHCSDIGTCSFAPLQLSVDITNTSTIFVSFPGWEDVDFAGTASIFASVISHFKINLCEMEYNNGILNMKHTCKTSKTCCHTCSSVVIDLPQTYESVLYSVVLEVVDVALNSKQTQLFVFYNSSSKNQQNKIWWATSASAKTTLFWKYNYIKISFHWANSFLCDMCTPWIIHFTLFFICCLIWISRTFLKSKMYGYLHNVISCTFNWRLSLLKISITNLLGLSVFFCFCSFCFMNWKLKFWFSQIKIRIQFYIGCLCNWLLELNIRTISFN